MVRVEILFPHCKSLDPDYRPPEMSDFYKLFEERCYDTEKISDLETIVLGDFISMHLSNRVTCFRL